MSDKSKIVLRVKRKRRRRRRKEGKGERRSNVFSGSPSGAASPDGVSDWPVNLAGVSLKSPFGFEDHQ